MATFFADIYAVVELPDRSPASWIKKRAVVMLVQSGLISSCCKGVNHAPDPRGC
jgi:hypothetical protein